MILRYCSRLRPSCTRPGSTSWRTAPSNLLAETAATTVARSVVARAMASSLISVGVGQGVADAAEVALTSTVAVALGRGVGEPKRARLSRESLLIR